MEEQRNDEDGQRYLKRCQAQNSAAIDVQSATEQAQPSKSGFPDQVAGFLHQAPLSTGIPCHGQQLNLTKGRNDQQNSQWQVQYGVHTEHNTRGAERCRSQALRQISRQAR